MRTIAFRVLMVGALAGSGVMVMGAEPPRQAPPLPVPPVERQVRPPYFARITMSGDSKMSGVFEACLDPAAVVRSARARAEARPANAPSPMTGCTNAHQMKPNGSIHTEISCDQAKGAKYSFRMVSDGTLTDLRIHRELYGGPSATGAAKTAVYDSRLVRLGACPADLKPGQMRRPGGPVIDPSQAKALREGAGAPPTL